MDKKTCSTSHKPAHEPLLYDRKTAALRLCISVRSLDYLIADKRLRTVRKGKKVMIPHAEIVRYAASNDYKPLTPPKKKRPATTTLVITLPGFHSGSRL